MQVIITDARLARSHVIALSGVKLVLVMLGLSLSLMLLSAALYHWVFLKGAREGWPVIGAVVKLMVRDEVAQRDRFMRENIDVMAKRLGEMQARMTQLESLGERVSGLAGINPAEVRAKPGQGGALVGSHPLSMDELQNALADLDQLTNQRTDILTVIESRLFEQKVKKMMVPTQAPVQTNVLGSTFGWRIDPFTGRTALHTGLDFPAEPGTPIYAAAGGVVVTQEFHPQYGNMVEIDHGNDLVTRYGHCSRVFVKKGDLIKRGQKIAEVGTTGRSTGPHLHFEVLVQGVPQDPQKFLSAGGSIAASQLASATTAAAPGPATANAASAALPAPKPMVAPAPAASVSAAQPAKPAVAAVPVKPPVLPASAAVPAPAKAPVTMPRASSVAISADSVTGQR